MIRVLQIRETPPVKFAGIDVNCQSLYKLFQKDININMLPVEDYEFHTIPLLKREIINIRSLKKSIVKSNADIIHVHGFAAFSTPMAIRIAKKMGKKIVFTPHFHPFGTLRNPFLGKLFFKIILKPTLKLVDTIITLNNEDTKVFNEIHKNVVRIPHAIRFDAIDSSCEIIKKHNMILFVGRIYETNKGIEHLYHLPKNKYEIHCVGVGNLERNDFIQHTNISDEELNILFKQASLVVVPSRYEAFSYVSLEAFSVNTPVVMSERVRIADYLYNSIGYSIFKYSDYDNFCEVVAQTINSKVERTAILSQFNPDVIKKQYEEVYSQLTSN